MRFACVTVVLVCLIGCRQKQQPSEPPPPERAFWSELGALFQDGKTNEVLVRLEKAFTDESLSSERSGILRATVDINLRGDNVAAACEKFLSAARMDPALADQVSGMIESYLLRKERHAEFLDWCGSLAEIDFPERTRILLYRGRLEVYRREHDLNAILEAIRACSQEFPAEKTGEIVSPLLEAMLKGKEHEDLDALLDLMGYEFRNIRPVQKHVALVRFRSLVARARIDDAVKVFEENLQILDDHVAVSALNALVEKARLSRKVELTEHACVKAIDSRRPGSSLFQQASRHWILLARDFASPVTIKERFSYLMQQDAQASHLVSLMNQVFYSIMGDGDPTVLKAFLDIIQVLYSKPLAEDDRARAASLLLDGSFLTGDYARALQLLNDGVPQKDEEWHATLTPKIKAHEALAGGRKVEAIGFFREFMKHVSRSEHDFPDPISGRHISKEFILGLNAARIAEIWSSLDEKDKAKAAYGEARSYYQEALRSAAEDSPTSEEIKSRLSKLPEK